MKKLSALVALVLCVTIGGVYAAWIYTGNTVTQVNDTISHSVVTATQEGDVGSLKIEENTLSMRIDQASTGGYVAELHISGSLTVHFDPNPGAPEDVINSAIPCKAVISIGNPDGNVYNGKPIYVATGFQKNLEWVKDGDHFHATITAADMQQMIALGDTFILDTYTEHQLFSTAEMNVPISILVVEGTYNAG